jgi:hypothetical protein
MPETGIYSINPILDLVYTKRYVLQKQEITGSRILLYTKFQNTIIKITSIFLFFFNSIKYLNYLILFFFFLFFNNFIINNRRNFE